MISLRRQLLMAHRRARAWSGSAHAYQCSLLLRKGGVFFVAPGSRSRTATCSTMARAEHGRMAVLGENGDAFSCCSTRQPLGPHRTWAFAGSAGTD